MGRRFCADLTGRTKSHPSHVYRSPISSCLPVPSPLICPSPDQPLARHTPLPVCIIVSIAPKAPTGNQYTVPPLIASRSIRLRRPRPSAIVVCPSAHPPVSYLYLSSQSRYLGRCITLHLDYNSLYTAAYALFPGLKWDERVRGG